MQFGSVEVDKVRLSSHALTYQNRKIGELANLAAEEDADAETAIKILKQARKKREMYGGR